ncbi:DUF1045 domain-containing protein [Burkholderia cepacia]|uniref:DUF1045 domain-containing protein n=1 Tax=Burkholderia cepacia TaxID=292 RepID=UPI002AB7F294|nr:DUF1045 domain-containing protein [Burkholderia cepacia]
MADSNRPRYAIYYTPPQSDPLTRVAAAWLGRDAFAGAQPAANLALTHGDPGQTSEPRRYGFHATLKAPFRLADGCTACDLEGAMTEFAQDSFKCDIGRLQLGELDRFLALVPINTPRDLMDLAGRVVEVFDGFRAPLDVHDLDRRNIASLDTNERAYLHAWGYPYVLERFRFHMTLTNRLDDACRASMKMTLTSRFEALLDRPYSVDALTLFEQSRPDEDFVVRRRFPLGAPDTSTEARP